MKNVAIIRRSVQAMRLFAFAKLAAATMKSLRPACQVGPILAAALVMAGTGVPAAHGSYSIPVPNGDFSQAANDGSIGGSLLGGNGSGPIGSGPWNGAYTSTLGLLLQPELTISPGVAEISKIAGVNVPLFNLLNSTADFSQTLTGVNFNSKDTYTLTANVDAGALLNVNLLSNTGVGIALTNNGTVLASTTGFGSPLVSLTLLSGTEYSLQLQYTTGSTAPNGNLGIELYDAPSGLLTANLLSSVRFSAVTLTQSVPEPASIAMLGMGLAPLAWAARRCRAASA